MPDTTPFPLSYFAERYFARSYWAKEAPAGGFAGGPAHATYGAATFAGAEVFAGMAMQLYTPIPPFSAGFRLEVDWDGDGFFSAFSDISADVIGTVNTLRGRDYASQLTGRSVAGSLQCTLRNPDGRYSSFNAASPLYGVIRPGLKVRAWALRPFVAVLWTGELDVILPSAAHGGEPTAQLRAVGALRRLGYQTARLAPQNLVETGSVIEAVLDAVDWPAAARDIDVGLVPVRYVPSDAGVGALEAIQEMEEAELGFVYEGLDFDIVYEERYHRYRYSTTSQASLSDAASSDPYHYTDIVQEDSMRTIYNRVLTEVTQYLKQAEAVLWILTEPPPYLAPGAFKIFTASYGDGFVSAWTTVNLHATGGTPVITIIDSTATLYTFKVTNAHGSLGCQLGVVTVSGVAYLALPVEIVEVSDAASQARYGIQSYDLASPWHINPAYAQGSAEFFVALQKDLHPVLTISVPSGASAALAALSETLALSDRITLTATSGLTALGLAQGFYIESIEHSFGGAQFWSTQFTLSPAIDDVGAGPVHFWLLNDPTYGPLGVNTQLAY